MHTEDTAKAGAQGARDASSAMADLYAALAAAQGEFGSLVKDRNARITGKSRATGESVSYNYKFADLAQIIEKTRPALCKNGLALIQLVNTEAGLDGGGYATVLSTMLVHKGGGTIRTELRLANPVGGEDIKKFGAQLSYLRRYQQAAMLNIAADDDDDDTGGNDDEGDGDAGARRPRRPPTEFEKLEALDKATSISALSSAMRALSPQDKARYNTHFEARQRELRAASEQGEQK